MPNTGPWMSDLGLRKVFAYQIAHAFVCPPLFTPLATPPELG
jgi:hypothetical protein